MHEQQRRAAGPTTEVATAERSTAPLARRASETPAPAATSTPGGIAPDGGELLRRSPTEQSWTAESMPGRLHRSTTPAPSEASASGPGGGAPRIQRKADGDGGGGGADPNAKGGGDGLPAQLKAGVEALSGMSLSGVRVHYNSPEPAQLQALSFARGNEIHVGPGQERHLAHEAWHVVQQKQGRVTATTVLTGPAINNDAALEKEADEMGAKAEQGGT